MDTIYPLHPSILAFINTSSPKKLDVSLYNYHKNVVNSSKKCSIKSRHLDAKKKQLNSEKIEMSKKIVKTLNRIKIENGENSCVDFKKKKDFKLNEPELVNRSILNRNRGLPGKTNEKNNIEKQQRFTKKNNSYLKLPFKSVWSQNKPKDFLTLNKVFKTEISDSKNQKQISLRKEPHFINKVRDDLNRL